MDGTNELLNHDDDDGDGKVDEDPPAPPASRRAAAIAADVGMGGTFLGVLMLAGFGFFVSRRAKRKREEGARMGPPSEWAP